MRGGGGEKILMKIVAAMTLVLAMLAFASSSATAYIITATDGTYLWDESAQQFTTMWGEDAQYNNDFDLLPLGTSVTVVMGVAVAAPLPFMAPAGTALAPDFDIIIYKDAEIFLVMSLEGNCQSIPFSIPNDGCAKISATYNDTEFNIGELDPDNEAHGRITLEGGTMVDEFGGVGTEGTFAVQVIFDAPRTFQPDTLTSGDFETTANFYFDLDAAPPVPEPGTALLLSLGLIGLSLTRNR
jgi:hypothetical protein